MRRNTGNESRRTGRAGQAERAGQAGRGGRAAGAPVHARATGRRGKGRTDTRVRGGRVARVDRRHTTPVFGGPRHGGVHIERQRPGEGFRHVLRKRDIAAFIDLLPDWDELGVGLDAIVIASGWPDCFGWYEPGMIALGAWPRGRHVVLDAEWVEECTPILDRLEVPRERVAGDRWRLTFDDAAARGFLLLDVLLHELGHHHDRMSTRAGTECPRGEGYAIDYAERRAEELWDRYVSVFG